MYQEISAGEQQAARLLIQGALERNWSVTVFDGEATAIKNSKSADAIIEAMGNTEQDSLTFRGQDESIVGRAILVWGNSPAELVADSSMDDGGAFDTFLRWHEGEVEAKRLQ